ncbi:hypothetical protein [Anaerosporobacter faecicola]|uniref:hypothetical protein n=1 Tax=Anaerosporobacter faecicola TaxID=2718714 RepID=UPI00143AC56D|nr:hypothetical protein [Anaerosporobacter faecicola]
MANHLCYLLHSLHNVKKGKKVWKTIKTTISNTENDYLIIFPEDDEEINTLGMKYLKIFQELHSDQVFYIVCMNEKVERLLKEYNDHVTLLTDKQMKNLLDLYTASNFYTNTIIVSLQLPRGRAADRLLNMKEINVDQIVRYGIFKLYEI